MMVWKRTWIVVAVLALVLAGCGRGPKKKGIYKDDNNGGNNSANSGTNSDTSGGTNSGACGNGTLDAGESCDPGIDSGEGVCPNTCQTPEGTCGTFNLVGSADDCTARCELEPAACADGDGCCPIGCDSTTDADCSNTCGNGVLEDPEVCDGDCPTSCDDGDACTIDTMNGSVEGCSATCSHDIVTACTDDDGCCPAGCSADTDNDCSSTCGNGEIDDGETCDGDCPTSCDDQNSCTTDTLSGSADNCSATCVSSQITNCAGGDNCCPAGCTSQTDSDCDCAPTTSCQQLNYECGSVFNGCEDVSCGTCSGSQVCVNNMCEETYGIGDACAGSGACDNTCLTEDASTWDGGYCSKSCRSDSDCGALGHCGAINQETGDGFCLLSCSSNADCTRSGYECFDFHGDGSRECAPVGDGVSEIGDSCDSIGDCSGGQGANCIAPTSVIRDGYCIKGCTNNSDCPSGSHCSSAWGTCLDSCNGDFDCRNTGYGCYDADEDGDDECWHAATGSGDVGDACDELWDCDGGQYGFCLTEEDTNIPGGYCIVTCGPNRTTCPDGSECVNVDGAQEPFCLDSCTETSECRDVMTCSTTGDSSGDVCWL